MLEFCVCEAHWVSGVTRSTIPGGMFVVVVGVVGIFGVGGIIDAGIVLNFYLLN